MMCTSTVLQQCPDLAGSSMEVTSSCCEDPVNCASGLPVSCSQTCAQTFIPFMNSCGPLLGLQAAAFDGLLSQCQMACPDCAALPSNPVRPGGRGGGRGGGH